MSSNKVLNAFAASLFSIIILSAHPAGAAVLTPDGASKIFPQTDRSLNGGLLAPAFDEEIDRTAGTSLISAGFDLRSTGEFPARMSDALVQSAAASDARLVGLMPISPEYAPLGISGDGRRDGRQFATGFMSSVPGTPKPEVLIILAAMLLGSAIFFLRRRARTPRSHFAFGT